jgi:nitrogen regulatory protein PII
MKLVVTTVKPFRARAVLEALAELNVLCGTVREVMGFGRQKSQLHRYLGSEYNTSFVPKVEISLVMRDEDATEAVRRIGTAARTGRMGDGKIIVLPCLDDHATW